MDFYTTHIQYSNLFLKHCIASVSFLYVLSCQGTESLWDFIKKRQQFSQPQNDSDCSYLCILRFQKISL